MNKIIEKYRKEASELYDGCYSNDTTWRAAILEAIFRPQYTLPPGKGPMTHLHPDIDKLHLPENIYIADWRKYRVEDHPALVNFQKRCHAAGLHDPWLRNFAHAFYPNQRDRRSYFAFVTRGLAFGFFTALTLFTVRTIYLHYYPIDYPHTPAYIEKYGKGGKPHH